jgi:hypothetical protein
MTTVLTRDEFGGLFKSFRESAFRLENLDLYTVPQEADEYRRFLAGEELPKTAAESEWVKFVKTCVSEGKTIQRVHAISLPLTPYIKYEIEWGYLYTSAAGEDIRLLDRANISPDLAGLKDFWLFDRKTLVIVQYDSDGRFLHGERDDSPEALKAHIDFCAILESQSTPLRAFLAQERGA